MTSRSASLLLVFALAGCAATPAANPSTTSPVGINRTPAAQREEAADIKGTTLDGEELSLADLRGKTVVLNAWASWCEPCKEELPILAAAARSAGPDVQFVGLNVKDVKSRARDLQREYGVDYPSIVDSKGSMFAQLPGLPRALPGTVVIDPRGRVRATVIGPVTATALESLLADTG